MVLFGSINGFSKYMFTSISHEKDQVSSLLLIWSLEAQAPSLFLLHYSEHGASVFKVNHGCHHIQAAWIMSSAVILLKKLSRKSKSVTSSNFSLLKTQAHSHTWVVREVQECHLLFGHVSVPDKARSLFKN